MAFGPWGAFVWLAALVAGALVGPILAVGVRPAVEAIFLLQTVMQ
jgi:hypothetical protein